MVMRIPPMSNMNIVLCFGTAGKKRVKRIASTCSVMFSEFENGQFNDITRYSNDILSISDIHSNLITST